MSTETAVKVDMLVFHLCIGLPTKNATLINFLLSSDAEILLISTD